MLFTFNLCLLGKSSEVPHKNRVGIYLFKANNGNTSAIYEMCSTSTIKTAELRHWRRPGIVIVSFEQISPIVLVFPFSTLKK